MPWSHRWASFSSAMTTSAACFRLLCWRNGANSTPCSARSRTHALRAAGLDSRAVEPNAAHPEAPSSSAHAEETSDPTAEQTPLLSHRAATTVGAVAAAAIAFACYPTVARSTLAAFFAAVLVVLAAIDLERRIIPNRIVLPATAVVLIAHIAIEPGRALELIV